MNEYKAVTFRVNHERVEIERPTKILSALTCLIFFQAFMIAPLIPKLSSVFCESTDRMGQIVPADFRTF